MLPPEPPVAIGIWAGRRAAVESAGVWRSEQTLDCGSRSGIDPASKGGLADRTITTWIIALEQIGLVLAPSIRQHRGASTI